MTFANISFQSFQNFKAAAMALNELVGRVMAIGGKAKLGIPDAGNFEKKKRRKIKPQEIKD